MRLLDFYEFSGIVASGVVLITASLLAVMGPGNMLDINLGASLVFIIVASVFGHILQGIENWFELAWWKAFGGMPTDWVQRTSNCLGPQRATRLQSACGLTARWTAAFVRVAHRRTPSESFPDPSVGTG